MKPRTLTLKHFGGSITSQRLTSTPPPPPGIRLYTEGLLSKLEHPRGRHILQGIMRAPHTDRLHLEKQQPKLYGNKAQR